MDILAHTLWAGVGIGLVHRRRPMSRRDTALACAAAALPDLLHALPVATWALFGAISWETLRDYALATPTAEPVLPDLVAGLAHHLHCVMHSALIGGPVAALLVWRWRWLWPAAWGWWSHIVIDVFTHSADFYPSPIFYPITREGFHGVAWNSPDMLLANYALLAVVGAGLALDARISRRARERDAPTRSP